MTSCSGFDYLLCICHMQFYVLFNSKLFRAISASPVSVDQYQSQLLFFVVFFLSLENSFAICFPFSSFVFFFAATCCKCFMFCLPSNCSLFCLISNCLVFCLSSNCLVFCLPSTCSVCPTAVCCSPACPTNC